MKIFERIILTTSILNKLRKNKHDKTLEESSSEIINSLPIINKEDNYKSELEPIKDNLEETIQESEYNSPFQFVKDTDTEENKKPLLKKFSPYVDFHKDNLQREVIVEPEEIAKQIGEDIEETFNVSKIKQYLTKRSSILESLLQSQAKYYKRENIITSTILGSAFFFSIGVTSVGLISIWPAFAVGFMTWKIRDEQVQFSIKDDISKVSIYEKLFSFGSIHIKNKIYQLSELNKARAEVFTYLFDTVEDAIKQQGHIENTEHTTVINTKLNDIRNEIKNFNLFEKNPEKSKDIFDSLCLKIAELDNLRKHTLNK